MRKQLPDVHYLRECFFLDEGTGILTWKVRPRHHFSTEMGWRVFNASYAGSVAGALTEWGYWRVGLDGTHYLAHRIVWKMATGDEPDILDHIDRNGMHNAPANLRACTEQQNRFNVGKYKNNKCGFKGVHACNGKWRAMIRHDGKAKHIGMFNTPEAAHRAYCEVAERLHGEYAAT